VFSYDISWQVCGEVTAWLNLLSHMTTQSFSQLSHAKYNWNTIYIFKMYENISYADANLCKKYFVDISAFNWKVSNLLCCLLFNGNQISSLIHTYIHTDTYFRFTCNRSSWVTHFSIVRISPSAEIQLNPVRSLQECRLKIAEIQHGKQTWLVLQYNISFIYVFRFVRHLLSLNHIYYLVTNVLNC